MRTHHSFALSSIFATVAVAVFSLPVYGQMATELPRPKRLGVGSEPAVTADAKGTPSFAWVMESADTGRARIALLQGSEGRIVADETRSGENREPVLAVPPGGALAGLAWIHRDAERDALLYREPGTEGSATQSVVSAVAGATIDSPALAFLDSQTPVVAWCETTGAESAVLTAWRFGGEWQTRRLSATERPYDVMPQILSHPAPRVWWYSLEDSGEFRLRQIDVALWGVARVTKDAPELFPTRRFPILFPAPPSPNPGAGWIEPVGSGETIVTFDPRRAAAESLRPAGEAGVARQYDPTFGAHGLLGWIEERDGARSLRIEWPSGAKDSLSLPPSARQLRTALEGDVLTAIWVLEPADGGNGTIETITLSAPGTADKATRE